VRVRVRVCVRVRVRVCVRVCVCVCVCVCVTVAKDWRSHLAARRLTKLLAVPSAFVTAL
jgi:hypothetical protein